MAKSGRSFGQRTSVTAAALAVASVSSAALGGGVEPGNDVFPGQAVAGDATGATIVGDLHDNGCLSEGKVFNECAPDTIMGVFDAGGSLLVFDDDNSPLGNGLASGVFGVPLSKSGGVVSLKVTGFSDYDFDGFNDFGPHVPHGQVGFFETFIDYFDAAGVSIGQVSLGVSEFTGGPEVIPFMPTPPAGAETFDAFIDNEVEVCHCGDVDFYTVTGLLPGSRYEVRVAGGDFDSVLGLFDSAGELIDLNDDDPVAGCCLSVINGFADNSGDLYFAITGFSDFDFLGAHTEVGAYDIAVTRIGCNDSDLVEPFDLHDLADIVAFVTLFATNDPAVDFDHNDLWDLADITTFVTQFQDGCPG